MKLNYPNIDVAKKSNEANMQAVKACLCDMVDQMNYYVTDLENKVEQLQAAANTEA